MSHRGGLAAAVLFAVLCIGGCSVVGSPRLHPTPVSPTAELAQDELFHALRQTRQATFRYTVRGDLPDAEKVDGTGAFDPRARLLQDTITIIDGKRRDVVARIAAGDNLYTREKGDSYWVHLDMSRVSWKNPVYVDMTDPTGLTKFTSAITYVQRDGRHAFTGRFSSNRSTEGGSFIPIGAPSISVLVGFEDSDFTATTDDQGWVTSITIVLKQSTGPTLTMTTTLTGHGTKLTIKVPPRSQVHEAASINYDKQ